MIVSAQVRAVDDAMCLCGYYHFDCKLVSDEAAFGLMDDPKRCWVKGARPCVPCQTVRECTYAYAAVNPFNGDMIIFILPYTKHISYEHLP